MLLTKEILLKRKEGILEALHDSEEALAEYERISAPSSWKINAEEMIKDAKIQLAKIDSQLKDAE